MSISKRTSIRRNRLSRAMLVAMLLPAGALLAQEQQDQSSDATTLDKVTVTGSRIKRAEVEGPAPITVITADEIEKQGFATVYDALNTLTQFTGAVQNEVFQDGFTPNASFLNLRGLGPGYQLVLVNGRRVADYPLPYNSQSNAVNLANIPSAAIDRIEVLSSGASAIYGSDAVAGVVNIIMKTNYDGDLLTVRGGTTTLGGGDSGRLQWIGGKVGDKWSLTYAFEYLAREEIFASQRKFMDSYRDDPSVAPEDAIAVIGVRLRDRLIGTGLSSYIYPDGETPESTCARFPEYEFEPRGTCGYFGFPATQQIRNSDDNLSAYVFGTYDLNNGMQAFAQFSGSRANAKVASSTQFWQAPLFYDPNFDSILDNQRIFTPSEAGGLNAQQTRFEERSFDFATGLRGSIFERFDWEATVSHARYELTVHQPRFLENAINDYFLGPQQPGTDPYFDFYPIYSINIDRYFNPLAPDTFQSLMTNVWTRAKSEASQATLVFTGDLVELPAGPLGFAAVLEGSRQKYDLRNDPRIMPDYDGPEPIYNLTGTGGHGERDRYALGVEFAIPIVSTLKLSLAGRYDKYDDVTAVDDAITWSSGLEFRPVQSLLLRGSYNTSFKAPDMHYVFAEESGFFLPGVMDEYRCRRDGFDPASGVAGPCGADSSYTYTVEGRRRGSTDLEEETAKSATIGFVWDITDNISFSTDWYQIKMEGGVQDLDARLLMREEAACRLGTERDGSPVDVNSARCQLYTSLVTRTGVDSINDDEIALMRVFPRNQSMIKTQGVDSRIRYDLDTDRLGHFIFGAAWTHVLKLDQQDFEGMPFENIRDDLQYFNQRSRVTWEVSWERDNWAANVNGFRLGSLPNWGETGRVAPYIIWNATVQKKITEKATIGLAVNNVFNTLHPKDDTFFDYPFFWRAYSPIGREVFASFSYRFN